MLIHLFLAVIYVIMVKNTITRLIFRRKSGETAPLRGTELSKRTQRSGSLTVLRKSTPVGVLFYCKEEVSFVINSAVDSRPSRLNRPRE